MAEHTPTPWRVEQGTGLVWGNCTIFDDGTPDRLGVPVTDGQIERAWSKGNGPSYEEMEANAAFIAKACNAHEALVKALQEAKRQLEAYELAASGENYNSLQINDALALALTSAERE